MTPSLDILISAGASPAAYSIIRHLKEIGHRVHAIDANANALPLARSIADTAICSPLADDDRYLPFIQEQIQQVDLFIPFIDEEIACLLTHDDSALWEKCLLPPPEATRTCLYKKRFQAFCLAHDLPVARFTQALPAVFKPDLGRGGRGVRILRHQRDLSPEQKEAGVIQDYVAGEEFTLDVLFSKQGEMLRLSARQRNTAAGVSLVGTIVDPAPFVPVIDNLAQVLRFRYLINVQVIREPAGPCHIIEINPRIAGSVMFSVYSGMDLLKTVIQVYAGQQVASAAAPQKKIRVIRYWNEYVQDL